MDLPMQPNCPVDLKEIAFEGFLEVAPDAIVVADRDLASRSNH